MADPKGKFPTMGTEAASAGAAPVLTGTLRPKGGPTGGGEPATANHRQATQERLGFKGAPQTTLYAPNAPEAAATQRNVRLVRSSIGNRDFYDARARAGL